MIAYELLAGRPPFVADTPVGLLYAHVHKPPPPLAALVEPGARRDLRLGRVAAREGPGRAPPVGGGGLGRARGAGGRGDGPVLAPPRGDRAPPTRRPPSGLRRRDGAGDHRGQRAARERGPHPQAADPDAARAGRAAATGPRAPPARLGRGRRASPGPASRRRRSSSRAAGEPDPPASPRAPKPPVAATPYDFDGDGRQELVMAMLRGAPRGSSARSGVVLVQQRSEERPWNLISEARAGLPGRSRAGDDFGSGLASGDFDRDGNADLAIGTPGRERVSVLYGTGDGFDERRTQQFTGGRAKLPAGAGRYGFVLVARDLDGDGYDELVVGAPGERDGQPSERRDAPRCSAAPAACTGPGARDPAPGSGDGRTSACACAPATSTATTGPTSRRAPPRAGAPPGTRPTAAAGGAGPLRCRPLPSAGSSSGLAIGDVNGDGRADIVQGDSEHVDPAEGPPVGAGARPGLVRRARRPAPEPGHDHPGQHRRSPAPTEPGDEFGAVVEAGDVDSDGFADLLVAAVRENEGAGSVTVIRGGRSGYAPPRPHMVRPGLPGGAGRRRAGPRIRLDACRCCGSRTTAGPTSRSPSAARTPRTSA